MTDRTMATPKRGSRFWLFLPFVVIAVVGAIWTAGWFFARGVVEQEIDRALAREARAGREIACASRTVTGFPFRMEVRCADLTITTRDPAGPVVIALKDVVALAMVWNPTHVIAEAKGPAVVSQPDQPPLHVAWSLAQASLRGHPQAPDRVSVALTAPKLEREVNGVREALGEATLAELHLRLRTDPAAGKPGYELAVLASQVKPATGDVAPIDAGLQGVFEGITDFRPRPLRDRLRDWQAAGGRFVLSRADVRQGDTQARGGGTVALDGKGLPEGRIDISVAPVETVATLLAGAMRADPKTVLTWLMALGEKADIDNRPGIKVPLILRNGRGSFGPIPVLRLDPLF
jgi:hypothetical protein